MAIKITKSLVYAAALDAYKKALRKGKTQDEARDAYHAEFDRLWEFIGEAEGWMELPT